MKEYRASIGDSQHRRPYFLDARIRTQKPPTARIHGIEQVLLSPQHESRETCRHLRGVGWNGAVYLPDERLTVRNQEALLIDYLHLEIMKRMTESLGEEIVCGANNDAVTVAGHILSLAAKASV